MKTKTLSDSNFPTTVDSDPNASNKKHPKQGIRVHKLGVGVEESYKIIGTKIAIRPTIDNSCFNEEFNNKEFLEIYIAITPSNNSHALNGSQ